MRHIIITGKEITEVWINAYYTSFACRQCSHRDNAVDEPELVFHLTRPCEVHPCLSLKYTHYEQVEVVSFSAVCAGMHTERSHKDR